MPYCPKCKTEYRKGFNMCADCNIPLVDELEGSPKDIAKTENKDFEMVLFRNLRNDQEYEIVRGLFEQADIPCHKQYPSISQWSALYTGLAFDGVNMYLRKEDVAKAEELLASFESQPFDFGDFNDFEDE